MPYDPRMTAPDSPDSPLAAALQRVGDRWSLLLVEALLPGPRRFGELAQAVPGIAPNILAERLRRLEAERVVRATPYSERPPRFDYQLTDEGTELAGALRLLADWGSRVARDAEPVRHAACGTPLEARWFCPTCARDVEGAEADEVRYV
jgi:DNA-binding HxlR family transcriptional regulator